MAALLLLVPVATTALYATLARMRVAPSARRIAGVLGFALVPLAAWPALPANLTLRLLALIGIGLNAIGNMAALDLRVRHGWDSLGAYLFDVLTLASSRLVRHLAPPPQTLVLTGARGLAFAGAAVLVVLGLERVPVTALPVIAWVYLKLQVAGLLVQALSDLVSVAFLGRAVPPMRFPMLSVNYLDFWGKRYNTWVHGVLLWVARDLLKLGRRPALLITAAFLVSGLLHELMSYALLREVRGLWLAFWVVQLALTFASVKLTRVVRRARAGRAIEVLFLHVTMAASAPLFFAVLDRAINLFGPVTPAPW